ncbi:hypothetical protein AB0L75_05765 [Streptomyces sp. NPDC052101]|uniref:hypothetical protein n=1 Tax=Streptomyces sp. NPDC052101 TaxID=3155763 RepID=UPI0034220FDA
MRAYRALVIAIATPVLLAAAGTSGAYAAAPQKPAIKGEAPEPKPAAGRAGGEDWLASDDDERPEEGILYSFANKFFEPYSGAKGGKGQEAPSKPAE